MSASATTFRPRRGFVATPAASARPTMVVDTLPTTGYIGTMIAAGTAVNLTRNDAVVGATVIRYDGYRGRATYFVRTDSGRTHWSDAAAVTSR